MYWKDVFYWTYFRIERASLCTYVYVTRLLQTHSRKYISNKFNDSNTHPRVLTYTENKYYKLWHVHWEKIPAKESKSITVAYWKNSLNYDAIGLPYFSLKYYNAHFCFLDMTYVNHTVWSCQNNLNKLIHFLNISFIYLLCV